MHLAACGRRRVSTDSATSSPQLLRLPRPGLPEEEGAEGPDGVARLPGEMRGEVPQKRHQKPEVQHLHLCARGESDYETFN